MVLADEDSAFTFAHIKINYMKKVSILMLLMAATLVSFAKEVMTKKVKCLQRKMQ